MAKNSLPTFRPKQDLTQAMEPSGAGGVALSDRLRFVIQTHAASRMRCGCDAAARPLADAIRRLDRWKAAASS